MSSKNRSETSIPKKEKPSTESGERKQKTDYGEIVGKISTMMQQQGNLSKGDLAELRRISPDEPFTPALWRLLLMFDLDESHWHKQEIWERRWATLLMGMAHCVGLHSYQTSFGQALAEAGWSELRFVQLMRAKDETLETHLRRVAQFLSSKNQEANWTDVAWLLFAQTGDTAEDVRLNISRDYYKELYNQENS